MAVNYCKLIGFLNAKAYEIHEKITERFQLMVLVKSLREWPFCETYPCRSKTKQRKLEFGLFKVNVMILNNVKQQSRNVVQSDLSS